MLVELEPLSSSEMPVTTTTKINIGPLYFAIAAAISVWFGHWILSALLAIIAIGGGFKAEWKTQR
jgi:hypothetical protein